MAATHRARVLQVVRTDDTFRRTTVRGREAWCGRCIFCNRKLLVALDGELMSHATLEHILPRSKGGDDSSHNLALACSRCNHEKGVRHDSRRSERAQEVVRQLQERRRERWRDDG